MKIYGFQDSYIDYPGKISCIIFTLGCNFSCPACHARQIVQGDGRVNEEEIFDYIDERMGWIDGIVISGGEPTLQLDLEDFCRKIKDRNLLVKLDTNGYNPEVLEKLVQEKLVDYIALDIKGPPEKYFDLTGRCVDISKIEKSIRLASIFPGHEFRTTLVPVYDNGFRWFNDGEVESMARWVRESGNGKWYLQEFVARTRDEMMDEMFSEDELASRGMNRTPEEVMERAREIIKEHYPQVEVR